MSRGKRGRVRDDPCFVNSVKAPPMVLPAPAPRAAPDENVANARERAREGGNACARIPTWIVELIRHDNER